MNRIQHSRVIILSLMLLLVGLVPMVPTQAAAQSEHASAGFVTGSNRIIVLQSEIIDDDSKYGLPKGVWLVSILDFTNFGTAPITISLGDFGLSTEAKGDFIPADTSQEPSVALNFTDVQANGTAVIPVDTTVRLAMAFATETSSIESPSIRFGDESANISATLTDALDPSSLAQVQPWSGSQGTLQNSPGGGVIEVNLGGSIQAVALTGVSTPPLDGCFGQESAAAIASLSGGSVWIEDDQTSEGALVWYWDASKGHLSLLNQALLEQGFAGYDDAYDSTTYGTWLKDKADAANKAKTGLWELCKNTSGQWINPPPPTAVPTKTAEEVRAAYTWIDSRDLVIRPFEFEGDKIAIQGTVFNIDVDPSGFTAMQIWLDGGSEAAVIVFQGDSTGIYEGTWITVYGTVEGTFEGTNAFGGTISQPLIRADIVDW